MVSGTKTETLTISSDSVGIQTVSVRISQPDATNSPLTSDTVNFAAVSNANQYNVNVEAIGIANTATLSSVNLFNGDYTFYTSGSDAAESRITNYYSIYAPDKDLTVEMDLYGGKGYDNGAYSGGEGGYSRVRFTMEQNVEYVIAGLSTSVNAPFVYRKATLIAAAGGGGDAGGSGNGGFGGGIGISGEGGRGRGAGVGGEAFDAGTLPADGIFGSRTSLTATAPDTKATAPSGGRALKCTRGDYWRDQGFTACEDVTTGQARISDGTVVIIPHLLLEDIRMDIVLSRLMVEVTLVVVMAVLEQLVVMVEQVTLVVEEDQDTLMDPSLLLMLTLVEAQKMPSVVLRIVT